MYHNRIGDSPLVSGNARTGAPGKAKKADGSPSENSGGISNSSDVLSLTDAAKELQKVQQGVASDSTVHLAKVAEIKARLESGDYKMNPQLIAEKFLEIERALGGKI